MKNQKSKTNASTRSRSANIEKNINIADFEAAYGLNIDESSLFLCGEITLEAYQKFVASLNALIRCQKTNETIKIYLSSYGGDVYAMFAMIDYAKTLKRKVDMIAIGPVISAGAFLFLEGATGNRYATKNASLMFHQLSTDSGYRTANDAIKDAEQIKFLHEKMLSILVKNSNKNSDFWEKNIKEDFYVSPEKALELGIITKII